eukprot:12360831-Karenia_brevis.AAC.1
MLEQRSPMCKSDADVALHGAQHEPNIAQNRLKMKPGWAMPEQRSPTCTRDADVAFARDPTCGQNLPRWAEDAATMGHVRAMQ